MTRPLMQDEDFEGLVSFVLDVCSEAVAAGQDVTPMAVVARMKDDHTPGSLGSLDLRDAQEESNERVVQIVHDLANRPEYDLCCYIAQGLVANTTLQPGENLADVRQRAGESGPPEDAEPVVITIVYSKEREGVAMHRLDRAKGRIERGQLEFPSVEHGVTLGGAFCRTRH